MGRQGARRRQGRRDRRADWALDQGRRPCRPPGDAGTERFPSAPGLARHDHGLGRRPPGRCADAGRAARPDRGPRREGEAGRVGAGARLRPDQARHRPASLPRGARPGLAGQSGDAGADLRPHLDLQFAGAGARRHRRNLADAARRADRAAERPPHRPARRECARAGLGGDPRPDRGRPRRGDRARRQLPALARYHLLHGRRGRPARRLRRDRGLSPREARRPPAGAHRSLCSATRSARSCRNAMPPG